MKFEKCVICKQPAVTTFTINAWQRGIPFCERCMDSFEEHMIEREKWFMEKGKESSSHQDKSSGACSRLANEDSVLRTPLDDTKTYGDKE